MRLTNWNTAPDECDFCGTGNVSLAATDDHGHVVPTCAKCMDDPADGWRVVTKADAARA